jgi:hypothetical protein
VAMASAICSVASASSFTRMISVSSKAKSGHESRIRSDAVVSFVRRRSIPTSSGLRCCSLSWRVGRKSYSGCSFSAGKYDCGIVCSVRKLADVEPVELPPKDTTFPAAPGIYAVYDKEGDLQYVGLTRRVSTSLDIHLKENSELCGSVKVLSLSLSDWSCPLRSVLCLRRQRNALLAVGTKVSIPPENELRLGVHFHGYSHEKPSSSPCFAPASVLIARAARTVFEVAYLVCHMERRDMFVSPSSNCNVTNHNMAASSCLGSSSHSWNLQTPL